MSEKSKLSADGLEVVAIGSVTFVDRWDHDGVDAIETFRSLTLLDEGDTELCRLPDAKRLLAQRDADVSKWKALAESMQKIAEVAQSGHERMERLRALESHIRTDNTETLTNALAEIARLRNFAGEAYQVLGALDAPENVLDNASAAANGDPLPHESVLPFIVESQQAASVGGEREAFEECWAVRGTDDEGNIGPKPLRSLVDQQRYRGDAVNGSWVWFQRGAAYQRAALSPAGGGVVMPERKPVEPLDFNRTTADVEAISWNACLDEVARLNAKPQCATCNDNGRIGGPSFYAPDEGGDPCPDCSKPQANSQEDGE